MMQIMIKPGPAFTRPRIPAARCLHLIRLNPVMTRGELVEATGLSQPTITRATSALLEAGLIQERTDQTRSRGRGRPTVPLDIAETPWMLAGIAVGTSSSYIGLYDTHGRLIRDDDVPTPVARLSEDDFLEHIVAGVHRLSAGLGHTLVSVGVTTSGRTDDAGRVHAPNLGWEGVDIAERFRFHFDVPVVVSSAIPAILGSETQSAQLDETDSVLVLFADDSLGAALTTAKGVEQVALPSLEPGPFSGASTERRLSTASVLSALADRGIEARSISAAAELAETNDKARALLDERARQLGYVTAHLSRVHNPQRIVVAGSAFIDDPRAPQLFAATVRENVGAHSSVELRLIPTHREVVKAIARAVALDPLLRVPLSLHKAEA